MMSCIMNEIMVLIEMFEETEVNGNTTGYENDKEGDDISCILTLFVFMWEETASRSRRTGNWQIPHLVLISVIGNFFFSQYSPHT